MAHLLCLVLATAVGVTPAAGGPPSPEELRSEWEDWRAERRARLTAPDGWTTLIGLAFPEPGTRTIGAAPDADVVLDSPRAPEHAGVLEVDDHGITYRPAEGVDARVDGETVSEVALVSDADVDPTIVELGSVSFFVIERSGRRAVRSRDAEHPARTELAPIPTWDHDPSWRLDGRFVPHAEPTTLPVPNVLGVTDDVPSPGRVEFEIDGVPHALVAMDGGDGELFLVFGDTTNRSETYGGGRFLYTSAPDPDGRLIVDFNRATNPPCAFTPWATCPLPPPVNRLDVAIPAGEKRPEGH